MKATVPAICVVGLLLLTGCAMRHPNAQASPAGTPACPVTQTTLPALVPQTVVDTIAARASVPLQRPSFRWWYGNDALWVYLYPNGCIPSAAPAGGVVPLTGQRDQLQTRIEQGANFAGT